MTQKECSVQSAKVSLQEAESRLRDAERQESEGKLKAEAQIAIAKADSYREVIRLREEVVRASLSVERCKIYLKGAETELEQGFEK